MHADDIFRAIGTFAVKFRWVVLVVWIAAAVAIPKALPSLASVTQGNNSAFLPASAPSEHATNLAAPLGISLSVTPVPVVAAVTTGSFSAADQAYLGHPGDRPGQGADRDEGRASSASRRCPARTASPGRRRSSRCCPT